MTECSLECELEKRIYQEYCKKHDTWWILGIYSGRVIRRAEDALDCGIN